jgi:hypothetical protein
LKIFLCYAVSFSLSGAFPFIALLHNNNAKVTQIFFQSSDLTAYFNRELFRFRYTKKNEAYQASTIIPSFSAD